jgi:hypothetical protein
MPRKEATTTRRNSSWKFFLRSRVDRDATVFSVIRTVAARLRHEAGVDAKHFQEALKAKP